MKKQSPRQRLFGNGLATVAVVVLVSMLADTPRCNGYSFSPFPVRPTSGSASLNKKPKATTTTKTTTKTKASPMTNVRTSNRNNLSHQQPSPALRTTTTTTTRHQASTTTLPPSHHVPTMLQLHVDAVVASLSSTTTTSNTRMSATTAATATQSPLLLQQPNNYHSIHHTTKTTTYPSQVLPARKPTRTTTPPKTSLSALASSASRVVTSSIPSLTSTLASQASVSLKTASSKFSSWGRVHPLSRLREKLNEMGIFPVLVYNIISQVNSGTTMSMAWYLFSARTGLSPLAAGQWKGFLAMYAPFLVVNNVLRPVRLAVALAWSKRLEQLALQVQQRLEISKTASIIVTTGSLYLVAVTYSATCFAVASLVSGVPLWQAAAPL